MQSLIVALVMMTTVVATGAEVTATRLDGATVVGELQSWDGGTLVLGPADEGIRLPAVELLSLSWSPTAASETGTADRSLAPMVELIDGTKLPIEDFTRKDQSVTLSLDVDAQPKLERLTLPDRLIKSALLQQLSGDAVQQWEEIWGQSLPSDVLAVVKQGGESVDYLEGTLGDITSERIEFKLGEAVRRVERIKAAGLIFYRSDQSTAKEPLCVIHGHNGLKVVAESVSLVNGMLRVSTLGGAKLTLPQTEIKSADFSAGKVSYLSELEPASESRTALVGLPASASLASRYSRPRRDRSAFGGLLSLWFPGDVAQGTMGHSQSYQRGLAVHSRTDLEFRVPRDFKRLVGIAGIEPATRHDGSARLSILGDGRSLIDVEVVGEQAPVPIEVEIAGLKRLTIIVDYGQNLDTGDWVNLCDLRMVK